MQGNHRFAQGQRGEGSRPLREAAAAALCPCNEGGCRAAAALLERRGRERLPREAAASALHLHEGWRGGVGGARPPREAVAAASSPRRRTTQGSGSGRTPSPCKGEGREATVALIGDRGGGSAAAKGTSSGRASWDWAGGWVPRRGRWTMSHGHRAVVGAAIGPWVLAVGRRCLAVGVGR